MSVVHSDPVRFVRRPVGSVPVAVAAAPLIIVATNGTHDPTFTMTAGGLLLFLMGGIDRLDVLTASQLFSSFPPNIARIATVVCIGIGVALISRFLAFLTGASSELPTACTIRSRS